MHLKLVEAAREVNQIHVYNNSWSTRRSLYQSKNQRRRIPYLVLVVSPFHMFSAFVS